MSKAIPTSSPGQFVDLDRRFQLLSAKAVADVETWSVFTGYGDELAWKDILAKRRVIILAEAGSGKSKELEEKSKQLVGLGKSSFFSTVEEVGTSGLMGSIRAHHARFDAWKASDEDAWFFIDSIDEAKKARIRLSVALQAIAEDIRGCEVRVHIVLSGRHSDWDFRSDLALVDELLALPRESAAPAIPPDALVTQIANSEDEEEPLTEQEKSAVMKLLPLDEERVSQFAVSQGIGRVDAFLSQLKANDLMRLASRPLDLKWMVGYWLEKKRFGPLVEMLDLSICKRAAEERPGKPAHAALSVDQAIAALRRIGAALVLQKADNVLIPDNNVVIANHPHSGIVLNEVVAERTGAEIAELLSRPIFIPVSEGTARLAQDNKSEVRSLLAAQWLRERLDANCPRSAIRNLLFASIYGEDVVIPSLRQTAAWLSIWDEDVGRELARRDPGILAQHGDPASLPPAIAQSALKSLVENLASSDRDRLGDEDQIRRLVKPEFAPLIRELWSRHRQASAPRSFLIKCILHSRLMALSDIAFEAATEFIDDSLVAVFGGRAVLELAQQEVDKYVDFVRREYQKLPAIMVWEVAEAHYPEKLAARDIAAFTGTLDEPSANMYFERFLKSLEAKVVPTGDLMEVLGQLLKRADVDDENETATETEERKADNLRALAALCTSIYSKLGDAPVPARLSRGYLVASKYEGRRTEESLQRVAHSSALRRRALFWAAADDLARDPSRKHQRAEDLWGFRWLRYFPPLPPDDLDWFLEDARERKVIADRKLAASAVIRLIVQAQAVDELVLRARAAAAASAELAAAIEAWDRPHVKSAEELKSDAEIEQLQEKNRSERAANDQSWQDFIKEIAANPEQLHDVAPLLESRNMDARVYHLWSLLSRSRKHRDRYAINSLEPLRRVVGEKASDYFREAVGKFWRLWPPKAISARAPSEQNSINHFDLIGLAGVSLEATYRPDWASNLTVGEAERAAVYATLELNGFPKWIDDLAVHWPDSVRQVLAHELRAEILAQPAHEHFGVLQDVSHANEVIQRLCAETLYQLLVQPTEIPLKARTKALEILGRLQYRASELGDQLLRRSTTASDVYSLAADFGGIFRLKPEQAVEALKAALSRIPNNSRDELVISVLIDVAGDGWTKSDIPNRLPFAALNELMKIAFEHVWGHESFKNTRAAFRRRGPSEHDAQQARNSLVDALMRHPGLATYKTLQALPELTHSPVSQSRARLLARERAERDSEFEAWRSSDLAGFESDFSPSPRSSRDLCRLALGIIENIQHDALHGDFQPGKVLVGLKNENLVQNWIAETLKSRGARRFSVERESHVANEKEPDVRLRVSMTQASMPIEIKVAESWTVRALEQALTEQLVGQYLQDFHHRWGILLLVHQKPRPRGWSSNGKKLSIKYVLKHLQALAETIAARSPDAAQPEVALIDVSALHTSAGETSSRRKARGVRKSQARSGGKRGAQQRRK